MNRQDRMQQRAAQQGKMSSSRNRAGGQQSQQMQGDTNKRNQQAQQARMGRLKEDQGTMYRRLLNIPPEEMSTQQLQQLQALKEGTYQG